MAIKRYMLFFTPMCPKCPKVKEFMEDKKLVKEWVDASTPEGLEKARKFEVTGVPIVIFFDENDKEVGRANDVEEIKRLLENKSLSDV
jgi:ribonucleoside-triphosphate reductase